MLTHCVIPRGVVSEPCMTKLMEDVPNEVVEELIRYHSGLVYGGQDDGGRQHAVLAFKTDACVRACKLNIKAVNPIA